jgi:site-specific DNA-methyltransferase (cytosine-N4-specific)
VDLILTSPPFPLVVPKAYGNPSQEEYLDWFAPFALEMRRLLKDSGSLVFEAGGAWKERRPVRSLVNFELPLMLCKTFGFHLAQEFFWFNPCTPPGPVHWVNRLRLRVKSAVSPVWWLSKTEKPKADNRRVLRPYGPQMLRTIALGERKPGRSPSGHSVGQSFTRDNGGAIPPNLLAFPGRERDRNYLSRCREAGLTPHPARFPAELPEFFINFLTEPGDTVLDPFAGSCVTGRAAEDLKRRWICVERIEEYLAGARFRFEPPEREDEAA